MHDSEIRPLGGTRIPAEGTPVHPNLIAALAEDRRRSCPCGSIVSQPQQPCRKCLTRSIWRTYANQCTRSAAKDQASRYARAWAWMLATASSMLRIRAKGAKS